MATKCLILSVAVYLTGVAAKCEHKMGLDPHNDCEGKNYLDCKKEFKTVCKWVGYNGVHDLKYVNDGAYEKEWVRGEAWFVEKNDPFRPSKQLQKTKDVLQKELLEADDILLLFKFEYYGYKKKEDINKLPMCFYEEIFNELHSVAAQKGYIDDLQRGLYNKPTKTGQGDLANCDYLDGMVYTRISATDRLHDMLGPPTAQTKSSYLRLLLAEVDTVLTQIAEQAKITDDQQKRNELEKYRVTYQHRLDKLVDAAVARNKLQTTTKQQEVEWKKIITHKTTDQLVMRDLVAKLNRKDIVALKVMLKREQAALDAMMIQSYDVGTEQQKKTLEDQKMQVTQIENEIKRWEEENPKASRVRDGNEAHKQYHNTYNGHGYGYGDDEDNEMMMSQSAYTPLTPDSYPYVAAPNLTNDASMTLVLVLVVMMIMFIMCICCGCTGFFVGIGCYVFGYRYHATKASEIEEEIDHLNNV